MRSNSASSASPAPWPSSRAARRSSCRLQTRAGRASCTGSAGCAISMPPRTTQARATARELAVEWIMRHRGGDGIAWEPAVTGRRLISWLSHAGLLLDGADPKTYETITQSLGTQLVAPFGNVARRCRRAIRDCSHLSRSFLPTSASPATTSSSGPPNGPWRKNLRHQILSPTAATSRAIRAILIELMLDLLPLRQCFAARERKSAGSARDRVAPHPGHAAIHAPRRRDARALQWGSGSALPAGLATVLAYDDRQEASPAWRRTSRYARLVARRHGSTSGCRSAAAARRRDRRRTPGASRSR